MRKSGLLFTGLVCCFFLQVAGQAKLVEKIEKQGDELIIPYEKYILTNGLTLIIHEDHSDPIVHVNVTYHVGSAREEIGKSGFAHLFEHIMTCQGSDHAPKGLHDQIVIGNGGSGNASTGWDYTNYFETVPNNLLEQVLWLEADRMGFLMGKITQSSFETERAVVINERLERFDNQPYALEEENSLKYLYPYGHPYARPVLGFVKDLNHCSVNDVRNFFLRWYGPNNASLTIGGDVNTPEVVQWVEKYFGSIPRCPEVKPISEPAIKLDNRRYVSYTDRFAGLPSLTITYPTVPCYDKDMGVLTCLAQVLGQGKNSFLYQLVKKKLVYSVKASSQSHELAGEFSFTLVPLPGKNLADLEKLLYASLKSFEQRGVTEEDINRFKGYMEAALIHNLQSVEDKVSQLAEAQTFTGNPNKIPDLLKMYTSFTREDVMNAYYKYIKDKGAVVLSLLPKGQKKAIARPDNYSIDTTHYIPPDYRYKGLSYIKAIDSFDRNKRPPLGPAPLVNIPVFWRKELSNGAKLAGIQNAELPIVTLSITIPGGHLAQANNLLKAGVASLFIDMMKEDTRSYTSEQFAIALQKLGSSITMSDNMGSVTFTVESLKKNFDKTMALLAERLLHPKFTESAFSRIKKQALTSFRTQLHPISDRVFDRLNYGDYSALSISRYGTEVTVNNITLKDIRDYYDQYMTSNGAKIEVAGNITQQEVLSGIRFLDKLPLKKVILPQVNTAIGVDKTKIYLLNTTGAVQTELRIGYSTGLKYDVTGDFYKATLMNYPLGDGELTSRLIRNLRENKGWTYDIWSEFAGGKYAGYFELFASVDANATTNALSEVMKEVKKYAANGPTNAEVSFMKNAISQQNALKFETNAQKIDFLQDVLIFNLPPNYVDQQNNIVKHITRKELAALAKKWIRPDNMNILLVGDKAKILPDLKKLNYDILEVDSYGNVRQEL